MTKRGTTITTSILLTVSLATGTYFYSHNNNNLNDNKARTSLLSYSPSDLSRATSELKKLKIRTYSDLPWGKNGRKVYFENKWLNAIEYGFTNVPNKCNSRSANNFGRTF